MEHFYQNIEGWFNYNKLYEDIVKFIPANYAAHFVEVGSWKGSSACFMAVEIINSGKQIKFDCVDTWKGSIEHNLTTPEQQEELYCSFLKNIEKVKHVISPVRMPSVEASKLYMDQSLDFVFIDAAHDYENVKLDIQHWLPKVKVGGVIAGHDYAHYCEDVQRAVNEILSRDKIQHDGIASWIYQKY